MIKCALSARSSSIQVHVIAVHLCGRVFLTRERWPHAECAGTHAIHKTCTVLATLKYLCAFID